MNRREFLASALVAAPFVECARLPVVAAREPLALATADTEAHVAVVDLRRDRVVRRVTATTKRLFSTSMPLAARATAPRRSVRARTSLARRSRSARGW